MFLINPWSPLYMSVVPSPIKRSENVRTVPHPQIYVFFFCNFGHFFTSHTLPPPQRVGKANEDVITVVFCPPDVEKVPIWAKNSIFKFYGLQENRPGWYGAVPRVLLSDLGRRKGPCHFGNAPQTVGRVRKHSYKHNKVCLTLLWPKITIPMVSQIWTSAHILSAEVKNLTPCCAILRHFIMTAFSSWTL